ncbi:MAG: metallophosphoesterase [Candidatus Cloacimonetes bacterium]|nr:metallophosphoesterase [Candidatus Cloacimonadota bacterium]MDD4157719.1 metallophosphoesterase [Candidatus Cloacimonadota bacterium]
MKVLKRILNVVLLISLLSVLTSCSNTVKSEDQGIDPFTNGGMERNMIIVISDMHLGADLSYAECNHNLKYLKNFLLRLKKSSNVKELVIAGDLLDEWFVPATIDTYQGKDQADFVQRIAETNKGVIDAFKDIINEGKIIVTYVPGNHDLTVTEASVSQILPGINQVRDPELGLGTYYPIEYPEIAIEHGHRYNFFCSPDPYSNQDIAPGTITPPGYFFTRIGALHVAQNYPTVAGDTLSVVTPNQSGDESQTLLYSYRRLWEWAIDYLKINNKFDEDIIVTNFDGFTDTYCVNDLVPYQTTPGGEIDVNLFKGIQDTWYQRQTHNRVQVPVPTAQAIANSANESELSEQAKTQYFKNPNSDVRLVIFGHTHVAKMEVSLDHNNQKAIYVNSGTWIDHNTLSSTKMEFVVITPQSDDEDSQTSVKLYNYNDGKANLMTFDSLRF